MIGGRERARRMAQGGLADSLIAGEIEAGRLVFVDEHSTNTSLAPLYAWSPKGQRPRCSVPRNWGANVTLLSSIA